MKDEAAPTATVDVRMLTSMAGLSYSYIPGDIVAVTPEVAAAWKAAGIADDPPHADKMEARTKELSALLDDANRERDQLRTNLDRFVAANVEGAAKLAEVTAALDAAATERDRADEAITAARATIVALTGRLAAMEAERDQARADYLAERNDRIAGVTPTAERASDDGATDAKAARK